MKVSNAARPVSSVDSKATASVAPASSGLQKNGKKRPEQPSTQARNIAQSRKNWAKAEDYLTKIEKSRGWAKAWELRERLERGEVTLAELTGR